MSSGGGREEGERRGRKRRGELESGTERGVNQKKGKGRGGWREGDGKRRKSRR